MTQDSINNYNAKRADAQSAINLANSIIDNGDATAQQIADEKSKVNQALQALNDAKQHLTADTSKLQNALNGLNRTGDTNNKNQIVLNLIIKRCKHYNLKLLLLKIMQIQ